MNDAIKRAYPTNEDPSFTAEVMEQIDESATAPRPLFTRVVAAALIGAAIVSMLAINVTGDREDELAPRGANDHASMFSERGLGFELFKNGVRVREHDKMRAGDGFTVRAFNRTGKNVELAVFAVDSNKDVH